MKNKRIVRLMLAADLAICSLWLLCINHELYFVPLLSNLLLIRIWISFSTYRRSRMVICPIALLAAMTVCGLSSPYSPVHEFFVMPWITFARGALSLFGANRSSVELFFGNTCKAETVIGVATLVGIVWLALLPLGVYLYRLLKRRLRPGRFELKKNIGLCAYLFGLSFLYQTGVVPSGSVSIAIFLLALFLVPLIFNRGHVKNLFTRGETAYMAAMALLAFGYVCGIGMESKTMITVSLLPAAFYALANWYLRRETDYRDFVTVIAGSVCFGIAQYTAGVVRISMLALSAALTAVAAVRFVIGTRKYLTGFGIYIMTSLVIPVLCIGYNPYAVVKARRGSHCDDYIYAPNGLQYVNGKNGQGLRDRFGVVLPAEYIRIRILNPWQPYFKVEKDGLWQVYDIERQEFVSDGRFSDIRPYGERTFILESADGSRKYLILPEYYNRCSGQQPAIVSDMALEQDKKIND